MTRASKLFPYGVMLTICTGASFCRATWTSGGDRLACSCRQHPASGRAIRQMMFRTVNTQWLFSSLSISTRNPFTSNGSSCWRTPTDILFIGKVAASLNTASASSLSRSQGRSEEHTSELQSRGHLVCRLLLEKKKCIQLYNNQPNAYAWSSIYAACV